jgi:hypothetical protein
MKAFREPRTWIVALMLVLLAAMAWAQPYQLTDLGNSIPRAINDQGVIVGDIFSPVDFTFPPAMWTNGQWQLIPCDGRAVDDQGVVIGSLLNDALARQACTYSNSGLTILPQPPWVDSGRAYAATGRCANGTIYGYSEGGNSAFIPTRWRGRSMLRLQTFGTHDAAPLAVSRLCVPVGSADLSPTRSVAVWWDLNGRIHAFPTDADHSSVARAVNDWGLVGGSEGPSGAEVPMLWDLQGQKAALDVFPGARSGWVGALSNRGQSAGAISFADFTPDIATLWTWHNGWQPRALQDLVHAPGWQLEVATGMNDGGQIVGFGTLNGELRGWLLTPTDAIPSVLGQ